MRIAIASDHGGYHLKAELVDLLTKLGHLCDDLGTHSAEAVDYPDYARIVAQGVAEGAYDRGILVCGTGQGMAITANKVKGVRAAVCQDTYSARMSREHNNANVLCLGGRVLGGGLAADVVKAWLEAGFSGEQRHRRRLGKISALEPK
ncbi:MAG TPA: ribose 5-phosphate isomerase B [Chloroflexi bacterium]|nr:ribose 5-phosphate isomerase B [Chloroflexota bacterium]